MAFLQNLENWFGGEIMSKIINTGFEYLQDQVRWQKGMKDEQQRLRENHPKIQAVVFASGQEQIKDQNPALKEWLWQLRDALDEADDVMDELEYLELQKQVTKNKKQRKVRSIMKSINKKLVKIANRALKIDPTLKRLEEALQKLDKVSADVGNFLYLVKDAKQEQQERQLEVYRARETGSLPKNNQIGRAKENEFVMQWLRNPSNESQTTLYNNISLLSIVGHGGMGKTTLLQHVYKHEMTKEFDLKMWVCVSNNFDVKKVISDMLESLKNDRPHLETLDSLQKRLEFEVLSKKFLLVLDDIWDEEEERDQSKWENVLAPLASGSLGSKILVTTRMESVALMIAKVINKKNETLRLEGLKEDECLQLLNRYAFANVENPNVHHNLRSIAEKIVKKLSGSPLAARVTGGVLNSQLDERHWKRVLDYDIGSQNDIFSILKLSYISLPKDVQNCFSLCCMFPEDYEYDKDDLVHMWISLDFIPSPFIQDETVKDVGKRYFDILVKKSLFDKFQTKDKTYFKLHDLLHELLRSISAQEYFNTGDDEELLFKIPKTVRHLSIKLRHLDLDVLKKMWEFKNLRSLYLRGHSNGVDVLPDILKSSRSIRLLYLNFSSSQEIPEEIGHLIHLRYLEICNVDTQLPSSLSNLYHLQFLISHGFYNFPREINNLPKMYYLKLSCPGIQEIGKLISLQELDGFYVKNEVGFRIGELEHMNELRLLIVNCLENVQDAMEACNAKLCNKRNLTDLSLVWSEFSGLNDYYSSDEQVALYEKVLDNLQPHNNIKKLKINSYVGARSAIWMNNINMISNLEYIDLENCLEWQILPPFGQLPFLKSLYLSNMPNVKQFDYKVHGNDKHCVFPSLQVLHLTYLPELEDWFDGRVTAGDRLFPCLTELYLKDCPKVQKLPSLPPKLEKLEINNTWWKGCNWLQGTGKCCSILIRKLPDFGYLIGHQEVKPSGNCQLILNELEIKDPSMLLMEPLRSVTSLQRLKIMWNEKLVSFSNEEELQFMQLRSSLCELEFAYLESLKSLPSSLKSLSSLKILCLTSVPQLQQLPNIPASLEKLEFVYLESLKFLPSSLESLSSLKILYMRAIPQLRLLPNIPASLEKLELVELESMQSLPSSLESLSSLKILRMEKIPQLQLLPNFPASLEKLELVELKSLRSLPSLKGLSSLEILLVNNVCQLQQMVDIPTSLKKLLLQKTESLQHLPSLSLSSLERLTLVSIPLQKLPDLPPSLCELFLYNLSKLDCLPSCLSSLSSLQELVIRNAPRLRELPDLPPSLQRLSIMECHPELTECYRRNTGSYWHKIAHIRIVFIG